MAWHALLCPLLVPCTCIAPVRPCTHPSPQAFNRVAHLIIRAGADDTTLNMIRHNMTTLQHLELYNLAVGYSRAGLRGVAHLESLRSLIWEIAPPFKAIGHCSAGHSSGWGPGVITSAAGLVGEVAGDLSAAAGTFGVPLLGTNPIPSAHLLSCAGAW